MNKMKEIPQIESVDMSFVDGLSLMSHIYYFEGPLLSHFKNKAGDDFLYQWADSDALCNRWLLIPVESLCLRDFFRGHITQRQLALHTTNEHIWIVDLDDNISPQFVGKLSSQLIPESYLPSPNSYFDPELTTMFGDGYLELANRTVQLQQMV